MYKLVKMMTDDDGVFFNPFMIGPPECSQRYEYKQPTYVTYPPYATLPKEHTNKSVSKGSFFAQQEKEENGKSTGSQLGEICFSKAIKKDMAAAKQLANGLNDDNERRIYAGRANKTSETDFEPASLRTLMPVRSKRSQSQVSKAPSQLSEVKSSTERHSSKLSVRSHVSKPTDSNVTLKAQHKRPLHRDVDTDMYDKASQASLPSKRREYSGDNTSHHSMRSSRHHQEDQQADKISVISARSQSDRHSQASVISRSKLDNDSPDTDTKNSRVSLRSKTTKRPMETVSHVSQSGDATKTDSMSIKSKSHSGGNKSMQSIQQVAESIQLELAKSMETTKSLSIKAAELNERLRAGNEFKHNRFNTLTRQCVQSEPLKRCRDDRMALWFKESVLS